MYTPLCLTASKILVAYAYVAACSLLRYCIMKTYGEKLSQITKVDCPANFSYID